MTQVSNPDRPETQVPKTQLPETQLLETQLLEQTSLELSVAARTLLSVIRRRRSFGLDKIDPQQAVPRALIEQVLEAARWAPSHGQTEPWRFAVFTGESRAQLGASFAEAYRQFTPPAGFQALNSEAQRDKVWKAPVWISLGVLPTPKPTVSELEEIMAVACAAQNMMLMASSLGLACKWSSGLVNTHPSVARAVSRTQPLTLLGFLYLGWPKSSWPNGKRAALETKVSWFE